MYPSPRFRDTVLIFICLPGYRLVGKSTLYCDGQQWSSAPPVCIDQPSTTATMLLLSSAVTTSTGDEADVVAPRSSTSYVPASPSDVPLTGELSLAPVWSRSSESATATTRSYLPASFSTPALRHSTSDRMSTVARGPGAPVVSPHRRSTADVTVTSSHATLRQRVAVRGLVPTWRRPLSTPSVTASLTTFVVGVRSTSPVQGRTRHEHASSHVTPDTLLAINDTADQVMRSSEDRSGGQTSSLVWYGTAVGACAVLLAVVGGVAAVCGLVVCRRAPAFRRYQLMDGDDEMQPVTAAAAAAAGRSVFYATQYSELTASSDDVRQNSLQQTQRQSSNDNCSFV